MHIIDMNVKSNIQFSHYFPVRPFPIYPSPMFFFSETVPLCTGPEESIADTFVLPDTSGPSSSKVFQDFATRILFNPPTPETFFASDFDDFCKYGSHATLEKGKGRK